MQNAIWMPSADTANSRIVGRFMDLEDEYTDRDGVKRKRVITVLEHKVPGSADVSASVVKPFNQDELRRRFPQAWELYQRNKEMAASMPPPIPTAVEHGIAGTPIEDLDFIGKDRLAFFKTMGFLVAEQIRDMSDADCQNIAGAKTLRKKAAEFLANKAKS